MGGPDNEELVWDCFNRLDRLKENGTSGYYDGAGVAEYDYLPNGLRCTKILDRDTSGEKSGFYDNDVLLNDTTVRYRYDGQMTLEEDATWVEGGQSTPNIDVTRYTLGARGIERIEAQRIQGSGYGTAVRSYPVYDGHGNPDSPAAHCPAAGCKHMIATLGRTSNGWNVANEKRYDAWGAVRSSSGPGSHVVNPNTQYCANLGHKFDGESDLIYMRARYYEPSTGRFISEDPARDGGNWYAYCANNPVGSTDFTGKHWEREWKGFRFLFHGSDHVPSHLHIYGKQGEEFSRRLVGSAWHGNGGNFPRNIIDKLIEGIRSGDNVAKNIARRLISGGYGIADDLLDLLRGAVGGFAILAFSSLDAYAQIDPQDFVAILRNIAGDVGA